MNTNKRKIAYLNANRLRRALVAGAENVISQQAYLDSINVFPVPDGDTGKNMAGTMRSIASASKQHIGNDLGPMANEVARSALIGARGNSGAILAQFMGGFSEAVKNLERVYPKDFVKAIKLATKRAKEAMSKPQEGTILTVIQDWSDHLESNRDKHDDFVALLKESKEKLQTSLLETKEKLAVLKASDVVDAGAQGFLYMIEGILDYMEKGKINDAKPMNMEQEPEGPNEFAYIEKVLVKGFAQNLSNNFCTECMLEGEGLPVDLIRKELEILGDCVVVAGDSNFLRLHVHTGDPNEVFRRMARYGKVSMPKAENMLEQIENHKVITKQKVGIVTDSTCDLPDELIKALDIEIVPLRVLINGEEFADKIDLSPEEINVRLTSSISASTSQPAPADFLSAYTRHLEKYEKIISLHVMELYSGTVQSANTVAKMFDGRIQVLDSEILCGGLGLVVQNAAKRARDGMEADEILALAKVDCTNARVFIAMDTLDFAVRGGRMNKNLGAVAKLFNLKAVIEFASRNKGRVDVVAKSFGSKRCEARLVQIVKEHTADMKNVRYCIGHVNGEEAAKRLAILLKSELGAEAEYMFHSSAVLGAHSGPGAAGICLLGEREALAN